MQISWPPATGSSPPSRPPWSGWWGCSPPASPRSRIIGCSFRTITGYPCPGCGLTRVADYFSHFNFYGAFKANPLGAMAAAGFAALLIGSVLHFAFKVPWPEVDLNDRDWTRLRNLAIVAFVVNYAFVILQHRLVLL